jgi:hypothetical protein
MYRIDHWDPDINKMSGCGFAIKLYPEFKEMVKKSGYRQENIDSMIERCAPGWLKDHGYNPEISRIMVGWGEWGTEHIMVPGNACGLDKHYNGIDHRECLTLLPHNVDSLKQASLILTVFCQIEKALYLTTI